MVSGFYGFWFLWFLVFMVSGFYGFWFLWFLVFMVSGFYGFWFLWFLVFMVSGFYGFCMTFPKPPDIFLAISMTLPREPFPESMLSIIFCAFSAIGIML